MKTHVHYDEACRACEIVVRITDALTKATLIGLLFYDKRKDGFHGRALRAPIPALGLIRGGRLEPSHFLIDVSKLETLVPPFGL